MKKYFLLLLAFGCPLLGQDENANSEDLVILSPFEVSSEADSGYRLAGKAVVPSQVIDPSSAAIIPGSPVSIVKRAEALAIQFVLSNSNEKQVQRNKELYASLEVLVKAVGTVPGLRLEQREVRFAGGERKMLSFSKSAATNSFASVIIFSDISSDIKLSDRVKQIRDLLDKVSLTGETKLKDGFVGLYLKNPNQYRREILTKIFEDLSFVQKGVGSDFEVMPNGLAQRVQVRVCSEYDLELWINYGFIIRSVRELEAQKKNSK
jgi:hypothetical protein